MSNWPKVLVFFSLTWGVFFFPVLFVHVSVNSRIYTACKSCVSVNHLCLHVQMFYIYTYKVVVHIFFFCIFIVPCKCFGVV